MPTKRKPDESLTSALDIAAQCDEVLLQFAAKDDPTMLERLLAERLRVAVKLMRGLHHAAIESQSVECLHTLTMRVTEQMRADGMDARDAGKYCMTCGLKISDGK